MTPTTTDPLITDHGSVADSLGAAIAVSAYAGHVLLSATDGPDCIDAHLSLAAAEALVEQIRAAAAAAKRIEGRALVVVP